MPDRHAVVVPILGDVACYAVVIAWHKEPGEWVEKGDLLVTVETRKAAHDLEADGSGYLVPLVEVGKPVKTGVTVAVLTSETEGEEAVRSWLAKSA